MWKNCITIITYFRVLSAHSNQLKVLAATNKLYYTQNIINLNYKNEIITFFTFEFKQEFYLWK